MAGRFRDIEHVIRVALLFVIGFGTFVAVRSWLVPDDFGVYGFLSRRALDDARARPVVYAGRGTCGDCHPDVVESRKGSRHEHFVQKRAPGPRARHDKHRDRCRPLRTMTDEVSSALLHSSVQPDPQACGDTASCRRIQETLLGVGTP